MHRGRFNPDQHELPCKTLGNSLVMPKWDVHGCLNHLRGIFLAHRIKKKQPHAVCAVFHPDSYKNGCEGFHVGMGQNETTMGTAGLEPFFADFPGFDFGHTLPTAMLIWRVKPLSSIELLRSVPVPTAPRGFGGARHLAFLRTWPSDPFAGFQTDAAGTTNMAHPRKGWGKKN